MFLSGLNDKDSGMKKILAGVIVIALVTPWFAFGQGTPQKAAPSKSSSAEKELVKLEVGWADAFLKADVAFLDRILADDYTDTDENGTVSTKAQDIADLKSGDIKFTSAINDEFKVRVYGNAAVVTGRLTMKAQYKGKDISGQYRWTDTWVKRAGHWQCVATGVSKIVEAKWAQKGLASSEQNVTECFDRLPSGDLFISHSTRAGCRISRCACAA
jgi:ketosteroid isomerase-like protein